MTLALRPLAAAAPLLLVLATRLPAQERDTAAATLPEIVVTATRYPASPDSVAASVTVLRGEELRARGIRQVGEALRLVPGAQVVQGGGFGAQTSLFLRGGESDYVKVLVDGVPVNQPGGAFDFANLATDNVERIEVVRGPTSVLYGSDAIAGVIQVVTRDGAGDRPGIWAAAEGGTYNSRRWEAGASGAGGPVSASGSVSRRTTDGIYDFNSDHRNTVAGGRALLRADERTRIGASGRFTDAELHYPTDFTGAPVDRNQLNAERSTTLDLDVARELGANVEGQLLVGRHQVRNDFENGPDSPADPTPFGGSRTEIRRWIAEGRALVRLPAGVRALAGVALDEERQEDFARASADEPYAASDTARDRTNWGFYLQGTAKPAAPLELTAGGRLDRNERFGSFWTYRAGALAAAGPRTRVRASVGTGFKEPSFFDNYATGFATGNPDLRPERSFSVELGVSHDLPAIGGSAYVTGFAQRFRDLIQFTFAPPSPGDPNFFNVAEAEALGVEVGIRVRGPAGLELEGSYVGLHSEVQDAGFDSGEDATFVEGHRLLRRPAHLVSLRAGTSAARRVRAGAVLTVVGARDDLRFAQFPEPTRRVELPAYATLDLSGGIALLPARPGRPGFDLLVRVDNVLDEEYEQAAGYLSPGRTLVVGGTARVR
jgi:vitamin B12 transporter